MIRQPIPAGALPPGETLSETLETLDMSQVELAKRTGINKKTINRIISGIEPLTQDTALALEKVFNVPAHFWLNLESRYRAELAREKEEQKLETYANWARCFPYPTMAKRGLVPAASAAKEKAANLFRFFAVKNPVQWEETYREEHLALSFRESAHVTKKMCLRSAWLRTGEIEAEKAVVAPYSANKFRENLSLARGLTKLSPDRFLPELRDLCAEAGVVYLLIPEFPGLGISGVMRWHRDRPVIQQTLRFKTNDSFWFTFFHEAKHVLQKRKRTIFLEGNNVDHDDPDREEEADLFARETLIPASQWAKFLGQNPKPTTASIREFAERSRIHPGIVVGRVFREKRLPYGHSAQRLQAKFSWAPERTDAMGSL